MDRDDQNAPHAVTRSAKHQEELNRLGRSWFEEMRQQGEREAAEFETWRKEHRKWTVFNKRSSFSLDLDWPSDDSSRD
jgi:hypothetical protein